MRYLELDYRNIVPSQKSVLFEKVAKFVRLIPYKGYEPIPVIDVEGDLVAGDGHHTGISLRHLQKEILKVALLENDEDVIKRKPFKGIGVSSYHEAVQASKKIRKDLARESVSLLDDVFYRNQEGDISRCRVCETELEDLMAYKVCIW